MDLLELATELRDAMAAAGLDARILSDPDRGAGVVIDAPELGYVGRAARVGCQDIATADATADILVIGAGWAVEQVEALLTDASTAFYAVPPPWRPTAAAAFANPDAPGYRISCAR